MNIEDLVQLLNNRLREFKLSRDFAKMSGDLERMNIADKEILTLEDTLFKLNLLVDTSKSAAVKEDTLAEIITDGSVAVLGDYDITPYATDPLHEEKIMNILSKMGVMDSAEKIDAYIQGKYWGSPVTGEMVMNAAEAYAVDARLMIAIMEQDSSMGTAGKAVWTLNPGNVGNNDAGDTVTYESWQEGVTAVARWLSRHRVSEIIPEIPVETVVEPAATSTSSGQATSTPEIIPVIISTTTTTPVITTSTSSGQASSTPETVPATTSTTTTVTTTPVVDASTTTTTPTIDISTTTTTPVAATSTPETAPVITSTTTTMPVINTPEETPPATTSTTTTVINTPAIAPSTSSQPSPEATAGTAG